MKQSNYEKVLGVFFDNPTEKFHVRGIARITRLNPNTVLNITRGLEKEKLIIREKKRHIVELSAKIGERFKNLKKIDNLKKIYDSGLVNFLVEKLNPEAVSVIGSYSEGNDIKKSDVDIVVITKKEYLDIDLKKFEKVLNRNIHLIVAYYNKFSDEFYTNLINGIVLSGYIRRKFK